MNIYKPYTYLIGWSLHNKWYYGVRFAKNCNTSELFKTYFTSSKYVKEFRENYGEPDVIQIRKIFKNTEDARNWEHKVLKRMNVTEKDIWLNKSNGKSIPSLSGEKNGFYGKKHTEETKRKIAKNTSFHQKGKPKTKEHNIKNSAAQKKIKKDMRGEKNGFYGKKHTEETKRKIREKTIINAKNKQLQKIEEYNKNPIYCYECTTVIRFKGGKKFCCRKCFLTYHNRNQKIKNT